LLEWNEAISRVQVQIDTAQAELRKVGWSLASTAQQVEAAKIKIRTLIHLRAKFRAEAKKVQRNIDYLGRYR
jgi:septal ring factor EnvC (AmiA/AmiB activator)